MDASNTIARLAAAASENSALVASANTLVVKAGDKAPLFGLTDIDGNTVRSDDLLASGPTCSAPSAMQLTNPAAHDNSRPISMKNRIGICDWPSGETTRITPSGRT